MIQHPACSVGHIPSFAAVVALVVVVAVALRIAVVAFAAVALVAAVIAGWTTWGFFVDPLRQIVVSTIGFAASIVADHAPSVGVVSIGAESGLDLALVPGPCTATRRREIENPSFVAEQELLGVQQEPGMAFQTIEDVPTDDPPSVCEPILHQVLEMGP